MEQQGIIHNAMCVGVVGLGVTGQAAVRYCLGLGARVLVSDNRSPERFQAEAADFLQETGVDWEAGGHTYSFLRQADCVIVSPGVPQNHEAIVRLQEAGIDVVGELAVAAPHLDMPVVAVTGTNGKTTVTSLIGEIVREAGKQVFVGGNIGTPVFDFLQHGGKADVVVLEVSSFQLLMAGNFRPDVGVLLNITPDHIDRHGSMADYAAAKMRLFQHQQTTETAVLSGDDLECASRIGHLTARCLTFGTNSGCSARIEDSKVRTKIDGEECCYDLTGTTLANAIGMSNAAAAILACRALEIGPEVILAALKTFQPGPHRIQPVGELHGVYFVNDSKATNTGAVIAALRQTAGKALLIAGGRDKGEDYRLLRPIAKEKVRAAIVIGEAGGKIAQALRDATELHAAATLEDAVRLGYELASPGDTVLLSPACASFDMFTSYAHRGTVFIEAVHQLIEEEHSAAGGAR